MTNFNYQSKEWDNLRRKVLRRDNYTCVICGQLVLGKSRNGHSPVVDHIETVKSRPDLAMNISNLRVLCKPCDNRRHAEKGRPEGQDIPTIGEDGFPIDSEWSL